MKQPITLHRVVVHVMATGRYQQNSYLRGPTAQDDWHELVFVIVREFSPWKLLHSGPNSQLRINFHNWIATAHSSSKNKFCRNSTHQQATAIDSFQVAFFLQIGGILLKSSKPTHY